MRGIVTSANIYISERNPHLGEPPLRAHAGIPSGKIFYLSHSINPVELRQYILYWDKIVWAILEGSTPNIELSIDGYVDVWGSDPFGDNKDLRLLRAESIVEPWIVKIYPDALSSRQLQPIITPYDDRDRETIRPVLVVGSNRTLIYGFPDFLINQTLSVAKLKLMEYLNRHGKGLYSIGQYETEFSLPFTDSIATNTLEIELFNCLPVPGPEISLDDILEFRLKRKEELLRFRLAMDKLYTRIIESPDTVRERKRVIEELQVALLSLHRVMDESFPRKVISTLRTVLDVGESPVINIIFSASAALGATVVLQLDPVLASAVGVAANAVVNLIKNQRAKAESLPEGLRDYLYLYQVEKKWKDKLQKRLVG